MVRKRISLISLVVMLIVFSCGSSKLLYDLGLSEKGPEERIFRNRYKWYNEMVHDFKYLRTIYLPDSLGLNNDGIYCLEEHDLTQVLDSAKMDNFRSYQKTYIEQKIKKERRIKLRNPDYIKDIEDNVVTVYFTVSEYPWREMGKMGRIDSLIKAKDSEINIIPNDLQNLLFSDKYKLRDSLVLPKSFETYCTLKFQELVNRVNQYAHPERTQNQRIKFNYSKVRKGVLWASSNAKTNTINVSPHLLRAVFIMSIINYNGKEGFKTNVKNRNADQFLSGIFSNSQFMNEEDFRINNMLFDDYFINRMGFIIRHELAHLNLGTLANEKQCDCYAFATYRKRGIWSKKVLGVYEELLQVSIKNGRADLWGVKNTSDLLERFKFVESISDKPLRLKNCIEQEY